MYSASRVASCSRSSKSDWRFLCCAISCCKLNSKPVNYNKHRNRHAAPLCQKALNGGSRQTGRFVQKGNSSTPSFSLPNEYFVAAPLGFSYRNLFSGAFWSVQSQCLALGPIISHLYGVPRISHQYKHQNNQRFSGYSVETTNRCTWFLLISNSAWKDPSRLWYSPVTSRKQNNAFFESPHAFFLTNADLSRKTEDIQRFQTARFFFDVSIWPAKRSDSFFLELVNQKSFSLKKHTIRLLHSAFCLRKISAVVMVPQPSPLVSSV